MRRSKAKRKLATESQINTIQIAVDMGSTLNNAVKRHLPWMSSVAAIKLVKAYQDMENAIAEEDTVLATTIRESLFPPWVGEEQPDNAVYHGRFPHGQWKYE